MWWCTIIRRRNEIAAIALARLPAFFRRRVFAFCRAAIMAGHGAALRGGTERTPAVLGRLLLRFTPELLSRRSIPSSTMPSRQPLCRIARSRALRFHDSHFQQETSLGFAHRPDQFGPGDQDVRQHTAPSRCATCKHG